MSKEDQKKKFKQPQVSELFSVYGTGDFSSFDFLISKTPCLHATKRV